MNKLSVFAIIILQLLAVYFVYLHISIHTTDALKKEYESGQISGQIEMYQKMEQSGVAIPDAIKRPYREKHITHYSETPASFFLVPAAFCVVLSITILFALFAFKSPKTERIKPIT